VSEFEKLDFDDAFYAAGIRRLCGVDEAGRGPLAGPVVAAAVILDTHKYIAGLNDSKKLSGTKRETLYEEIRQKAAGYGIGAASVEEIERLNILQATFLAMQRALNALPLKPEYILVDGRDFPLFADARTRQALSGQAVVKGDGKSQNIAAASILAKVYRDRLMIEESKRYPQYGFEKHKGYGTARHRAVLREIGPCAIHRRSFIGRLLKGTNRSDGFV